MGRWTQVVVPITVQKSTSLQLELTAVDSDGNRVGFLSPSVALEPGERQLVGLIKVGRLNGEVGIRIDPQSELRGIPGRTDWLNEPLRPATRLVVTVGDPRGLDFDVETQKSVGSVKVSATKVEDLPTNPRAYDGVTSVIIAGSSEISPAQADTLRDWVASGGRLVISLRLDPALARRSLEPLAWFPVSVGDQPVTVREFGGLESFSGKNVRIPQAMTLSIPSVKSATGETLAASRSTRFWFRPHMGWVPSRCWRWTSRVQPMIDWKRGCRHSVPDWPA